MPQPAAELVVYCYSDSEEDPETANKIVREFGFRPAETTDSVIQMSDYTAHHYEYFEDREENKQLLNDCVENLVGEFPDMEVWIKNKRNKDYGSPISEDYLLYIAHSRDVVNKNSSISDSGPGKK